MKAAQINDYDGPTGIELNTNVAKPKPQPDQVLVEVHAAAINPFDITVSEGRARQMAELNFPATLGGDFAGVIVELGNEVEGLSVGQAVYGQAGALSGQGSLAEYVPVKSSQLATKSDKIDFTQAAALPLVTVSAYQALVDTLGLQAGQKILIHGGAGGIGSIAVQLAKYLGAYVAATASAADQAFVEQLGADEVIDFQSQDFTTIIKDYDAVFDTVGGETNRRSYQVLRPSGWLVAMIAQPDENLIKQYNIRYESQFTRVTTECLNKISELVNAGAIKPQIDKTYTLEQAAEAFKHLKSGHPRGKVVISIEDKIIQK